MNVASNLRLTVAVAGIGGMMSCVGTASDRRHQTGRSPLVLIDSVMLQGVDQPPLGRLGEIAANAVTTFIADATEGRVLEVSADGRIIRTFGVMGRGPGEFVNPGSIAIAADSAILVMDNGQRRVHVFSLVTGKYLRSFTLNAFLPTVKVFGPAIYASSLDESRKSSLLRMAANGDPEGAEGAIPAIAAKMPMLLQPFPHAAFTMSGGNTYMVFELSNELFSWKTGSVGISTVTLPAPARRGADAHKFERMVKDPANAGAIAYDHSVPSAMDEIAPGVLALTTYDPVFSRGTFSGPYYLTLIDLRNRRVCADTPVPAPRDPLPRVTVGGGHLVVVQQAIASESVVTAIRRFRIDPSACAWEPLR